MIFWKNGFTVDTAATTLRSYDDPANKTFLEDIDKGLVPLELQSVDRTGTMDFGLAIILINVHARCST